MLAVVGATVVTWTAVLAWPGRAPLALLVLLALVLGTNGPASMIGFDYARTENPAARLGSASGVVNVGGFVASLLAMLGIGVVLDLLTPGGSTDWSLGAFKAAFAVQYAVWALGAWQVWRYRQRIRARLARRGRRARSAAPGRRRSAARDLRLPLTRRAGRWPGRTTAPLVTAADRMAAPGHVRAAVRSLGCRGPP